jgi:hypothetical protein
LPPRGEVAQLVEHTTENRGVAGSIPALAIQDSSLNDRRRRSASGLASGSIPALAIQGRPRNDRRRRSTSGLASSPIPAFAITWKARSGVL